MPCSEASRYPCEVCFLALFFPPTAERRSRRADVAELLWKNDDAKEWLSVGHQWWPREVRITICSGTRRAPELPLDDAALLDTSHDVDLCLLDVQRQRLPPDGKPLSQLKPADWLAVVHKPTVAEAVAALHALELDRKLTGEDVTFASYPHAKKMFAKRYYATLPDLRCKQSAKRPAAPVGVLEQPSKKRALNAVRVVGLMPQWQPPAPSPHRPDWAGGRVVVHRAAFSPQQVSAATTLLRACTYKVLANQRDRKRLLSSRCDEGELLSALRTLARTLLPPDAAESLEVPWAAFLLTMPECLRQLWHKDDRDPRVWSVIVALGSNPRVLMFRVGRREMPITIAPGDAVLFRGDVCHCGGASSKMCHCADPEARCNGVGSDIRVNLDCVELAVHAYVVTTRAGDGEFDMRHLGDEVPPCDGDSSD